MKTPSIFCLLLWMWIQMAAAQVAPNTWQRVYPLPTGETLRSIVWGTAGFVAVGYQSEMLFSETGGNWERIILPQIEDPSYADFSSVSFVGGRYFVPASQGRLMTSVNARDWSILNVGSSLDLRFVSYTNNQWLAFSAYAQTVFASSDLIRWEARSVPANFVSLVEAGAQRVALASDSRLYVTTDLITWTERPWFDPSFGFVPPITKICQGGGRYVAVGGNSNYGYNVIYSSADAINWSGVTITGDAYGQLQDCGFSNGRFFAVGSYGYSSTQSILTSMDSLNWQAAFSSTEIPLGLLSGVAGKPGGKTIAVGGGGTILAADDGINWLPIGSSPKEYLHRVLSANGRFVAVGGRPHYIGGPGGSGAIFSSSDGQTWDSFVPDRQELLSDVAFGNGKWVVTGDDGGVFVSSDSSHWTDVSIDIGTHDLSTLVFGNGKFLAFSASRDLIYSSTDGVNWTENNVPGVSRIRRAKFLNGRFAAVGDAGTVIFSNDGLIWTTPPTGFADDLNTISYGKGRWVVGGYFVLGYSLDGSTWHTSSAPMQVLDIDYLGGRFLGVGNISGMVTSSDGVTWESVSAPVVNTYYLESIANGNGFVVCAGELSIYRAPIPSLSPWPSVPAFLFPEMLEFYGETGREYRLMESDNLSSWHSVSDWRSGQNEHLTWDAPKAGVVSRFWRVERR